jgi:methylated-DNA-[protein]-cysteine S-methyltransferase
LSTKEKNGKNMAVFYKEYQSPLGGVVAAAEDDALIGLWFSDQKYYPASTESWTLTDEYPVLEQLSNWLEGYFDGENSAFTGKLAPKGSEFRQEVWQILRDIPYGQTMTYGSIAQQLAKKHGQQKMSAQAVGGAVGHNPISLVIPCHRVIGAAGKLTGYAGGLDKKEALLKLEGVLSD